MAFENGEELRVKIEKLGDSDSILLTSIIYQCISFFFFYINSHTISISSVSICQFTYFLMLQSHTLYFE